MPNIVSVLGHQFTVSSVDVTYSTDTFINVIKRREEILYRTNLGAQVTNISFVGGNQVLSSTNLSIADRSTSLAANRVREVEATTVSSTKTFTIDTENFVVTDVFTDPTQTIAELPLFYKHTLQNITRDSNGDLDTDVVLVSVQLLDTYLSVVNIPEIKIDYDQGIVYSNVIPEYNSANDYSIYYIKYTVRESGVISTYTELLNNQPVYVPATYDDLGPTLEIINDGRKVYLISEITSGLEITLPVVGTYSFKPTVKSRLAVSAPPSRDTTDPWYVLVDNGKFFSNIGGTLYKYYIAEFLSQVFTPEPPIKISYKESSAVISDNLIKTDYNDIYEDDDLDLHINVEINTSEGVAVAAFTTSSSEEGNIGDNGLPYVKWDTDNRIGIRSIDSLTGLIDIEGVNLKSTYEIESSYYYTETSYEFTLVDFNPISNRTITQYRTTLFITPEDPVTTETQTLYYLKTDQTGRVFESNWPEFDNETEQYNSKDLYYETKPDWKPAGDYTLFVGDLSVEGNGTFLILADMTVADAQDVSQLTKIDSRRRGGGILDTMLESAKDDNPEAHWYWDEGYWDGIPYPGNASYYVEVPVDVMENAGGRFQAKEIRDVVERHTAAGVYPIIRAYGIDIDYQGIDVGNSITLYWFGKNVEEYLLPTPDSSLSHQFSIGSISLNDILTQKFTVSQSVDSVLKHSVDVSGISVDYVVGNQFDVYIPPATIPMETLFSQVSGESSPHPYNGSTFCSMSGFTAGDRYLVIANGGSNPTGYGMHHQIRFSGVTDPNLQWYHRNRESLSGSATAGQTAYMMKLWTPGAGGTIDWRVDSYDLEAPSYGFSLRWPSIIAMNMDSGGLVENTDWFYNEHNTPMYNINATYNDNVGAQITFIPDGTSDYLIIGSGQFFPDNNNVTPNNVQWMELSDSVDGFLCDDGYSKSDSSTTGSSHINNAMWILEAPSATSRTISLKFRSNSGYATYDYKHSALWIFRLNKSASYSYSQSVAGTDVPGTSETTLTTVPFTPASTTGLFFSRMAWYSSGQTIRHWQRMYWDGGKVKEFINSMPGWGSYSGTFHTSDSSSPLVGTNQIYRHASLTPDVSKNLTVSHQPTQNSGIDYLYENCTVAFDALMTQG